MKNGRLIRQARRDLASRGETGFTLPEAMIASTLFLLLLAGLVGANLFGMRMFNLTESKLLANTAARKSMGLIADEIRKCNNAWIGNVTNGTFVAVLNTEVQRGSAMLIQPGTNATNVVMYYLNPDDQSFRRTVSATETTQILAQPVVNASIFMGQDCFGNVLTNAQENQVVHVTLEIYRPQPWLPDGDYSKMETSVSRRVLQ